MSKQTKEGQFSRRDFLKASGLLLSAFGAAKLNSVLNPQEVAVASSLRAPLSSGNPGVQAQATPANLHMIATDGWIYIDPSKTVAPYHPDNMAPNPFTTYVFGYRDMTAAGNNTDLIFSQKMKCQLTAPLFFIRQEQDFTLDLTNLGLQIRPDLIDSHTLHFHGFRNAIPIFDGEPHSSVGVPIARNLRYFYRPHDPGTYMYHCHFEETEHVHMGMIGPCFVTPIQNEGTGSLPMARMYGGTAPGAPQGYVYNDGDGSTAYDREFVLVLSEIWTVSHWCDSHVQLPEWSDYKPEFYLINGRAYPDTIKPNGLGTDPTTMELVPHPDNPELQYQPTSSLITANSGERILLRVINLGFEQQTVRLDGIKMKVVGKDATLLKGRNGADLSFFTNTIAIAPGESLDAIFTAPDHSGGGSFDRYLFYNRNYARLNDGGHRGYGGQMTEVHVFPNGTLPPQTYPNT